MSEAPKGPDEAEEGQCDSGIESLRSLRSFPEPTATPSAQAQAQAPAAPSLGAPQASGPKEDPDAERTDSTYGSSSLTDAPWPWPGDPELEPPAADTPRLSLQQLEALTYISEDGDT